MPYDIPRPCNHPGCPALVTGAAYCAAHLRAREQRFDRKRGSAHQRGYGAEWRRIREAFMQSDRMNWVCATEGCNSETTDIDHIVPRSQGGTDDFENLQGLCHACHSRKTVSDGRWSERGRG